MPLASGTKLGPYEIESQLGAGGMGEVYRARDPRLRRDVAIKVLPETLVRDTDRLSRFETEAQVIAALNHPNILAIFDIGEFGSAPYIVSELLQGETLRDRLGTGPLPVRKVLDYAQQIACGLAAAHDKGIVHRDLKPENLFLTREGRIKILDFGIAKLLQPEPNADGTRTAETAPGLVVGTAGYMAPEQVRGGTVDSRTDLFALGAVLYEMLTARRAFQGHTAADTMAAILGKEPPELSAANSQVPLAFERIILRCLEKRVDQRFQSARDLSFALENVETTTTNSRAERLPRARGARWTLALLGFVIVAAVAFLFVPLRPWGPRTIANFDQVTFRKGFIPAARFAPDGQTVLYAAAWDHPPLKIYSSRADGTDTHALDLPPSELLAVSHNGELAILLGGEGKAGLGIGSRLARVSTGGAPRELLDNVVAADWSPDGQLAIARVLGGKCQLEYPIGKVLHENLGFIDSMRFSPAGDAIAYLDHPLARDDRGTVMVTNLGGETLKLTQEWEGEEGLAWSPNGREIWFTATPAGEHRSLYAVTTKGKQRTVLRIPGSLALDDIAPDGRVLLGTRDFHYEVMLSESDGIRPLSWLQIMGAVAFSHDGTSVVMDDMASPETDYRVYWAKLDGSPAILLGSGAAMHGSISPDDKWVATILPSDLNKIQLLPTGVGEVKTVTSPNFSYRSAAWATDGSRLVVRASEAGHAIRVWTQQLDGNPPHPVTPEGTDGVFLTLYHADYVGVRDGTGDLRLLPIGGGQPILAKGISPSDELIVGAPDSDGVYVTPDEFALPMRVVKVNIKTGARSSIATIKPGMDPAGVQFILDPLFSADPNRYVFTQVRVLSVLYVASGLK